MAVQIPVTVSAIKNDLPKVKADVANLDAAQKKAIQDHLAQLALQRRIEAEMGREAKERIRESAQAQKALQQVIREQAKEEKEAAKLVQQASMEKAKAEQQAARVLSQAAKEQAKAEALALRGLRERISGHQKLIQLSEKLNRDLEKQARLEAKPKGGGGGLGGMLGGLGGALGALGLGVSIQQAVQFGKEAEEMGRQLEGVQARLRNTLGGAEEYARAIALAKEETKGMTSEADLATGMFTFLNANLADTVEQAANLSRAQGILVSTFQNLGANEEKFIRLLSGGNIALYDNFNLTQGAVNARKAQIEATQGLSGEEAKLAAIKELVVEKADELEGSLTDGEIAQRRNQAAAADLKAAIGELLVPAFTAARDAASEFFEALTPGVKGFSFAIEQASILSETQRRLNEETGLADTAFNKFIDTQVAGGNVFAANIKQTAELTKALFGNTNEQERFKEIYQQVLAEKEKEAPITQQNTEATEENTEALEKEAKRLEKVADLRERSIRKALEIEENFQEDSTEAWDDWREDQTDLFEDYGKKREDILKKSAKDALKAEKDLAKDLSKLSKDLAKDLANINKDEQKKIAELKQDAAKERRQENKKRAIDVLADERIFQFELRAMAAEGDAAGIQQALERRAIEEQIAKEKSEVEKQIKNEDLRDEIQRVKQEAQEKREERQQEAEERRQELMAEAEEEKAMREAALAEALEEEKANFFERSEELAKHRRDKLEQLDKSRKEALGKIGQELSEVKDITRTELEKLIPIFDKLGVDVGVSFSKGINKGFDINDQIAGLLGQQVGNRAATPGFRETDGGVPDRLSMNFQHGGSFIVGGNGGPDSQRVAFNATPGERVTITPPGQGGITINASGPSVDQLVAILQRKVDEGLQEYTDKTLAMALE